MSFNSLNFSLNRGIMNALTTTVMPAIHQYGSTSDAMATIIASGYFNTLVPPQDQPSQPNISIGINDNYIKVGDFILVTDSANESTIVQITQVSPTVIVSESAVDIPPGSIGTAQLADGAVTTPKLADGAVVNTKIGDDQITQLKLTDNSVGTNEIIDLNVTEQKLAANSVTTPKISALQITRAKLALEVFDEFVILGGQFSGPWAAPQPVDLAMVRSVKTVTVIFPEFSSAATIAAPIAYSAALPADMRPAVTVFYPATITSNSVDQFGMIKVDTSGVITIYSDAAAANFANTGDAGIFGTTITFSTV